jgi:hypothetical protein
MANRDNILEFCLENTARGVSPSSLLAILRIALKATATDEALPVEILAGTDRHQGI